MSARDTILQRVRTALGAAGGDAARSRAVAARLAEAPAGIVPARGRLDGKARTDLFVEMAEKAAATVQRVRKPDSVPRAVAAYLRGRNLPAAVRMGDDPRLAAMPWDKVRALEIGRGAADPDDEVGVSHAYAGIAETGTVMVHSGADNPTGINFLPEHHIVVVDAADIEGDMEAVIARVRAGFGKGTMPRSLNLITGPSRSGDIEQTLLLGAHGPRAVHLIVIG
ncbi:lactate utilization protein [Aquibium sp. A9E412]|uniref:LutC/YkgG family protein n=1 Tax=Aquibium sp. A9E412 TaxID=2976767 RepID=UPI0025B1AA9A|nr:lactate utilization protein [Aquibium sp. A9E412]MDN2567897.1 lactate utilization protein [Aquibium sp. A9E412]